MDNFGTILGYLSTVVSLISVSGNIYLWRRARRAEVSSRELATADQMIELVKKSFEQALALNQKEIEKLNRKITQLYKAIKAIGTCPHRATCPVTGELQSAAANDQQSTHEYDGQRPHCRDPARYNGGDQG